MKIDRLIGILSILLQQDKVTAPYLAQKFEVSRRTINRDIEDICRAGIPLVTTQGRYGGIAIMEGYGLEKTLLTSSDMQAILAGLKSLNSVCDTSKYQHLMDKISMGNSNILSSNNHILIDLSSWDKKSLAPKIELFQRAINRREKVRFQYYGPGGEGRRVMEPYLLVFQWASWYVWGFCEQRQDYRMFKLNRMSEIRELKQPFNTREVPALELKNENIFPQTFRVEALFEVGMKWRLVEEYGIESFCEQPDGRLLFEAGFTDKEKLISWMLSFGSQVELLKPEELRIELIARIREMAEKYEISF